MENQKLPEGVELFYTDRAVHLTTNEALMTYLRQRGTVRCRSAARFWTAMPKSAACSCKSRNALWPQNC